MLKYFKRCIRFIVSGQPEVNVTATINQIQDSQLLTGKRIVVTGGGRGLGLAIANKCSHSGARVVISGRNEETLKQACKQNPNLDYVVSDVSDINQHDHFMTECENLLGGKCDTLVNNAGISLHEGWYGGVTEESWDKQFNTNLKAPYFLTQAFLRRLENSDVKKNIIFISSERGLYCDDIPYGLIKAAINSLTAGLGRRLLAQGVYVNAIAPGVTASDMTGYKNDGNLYRPQACSKRVYLPEEVAETVAFLISDAAKCISSQIIPTQNGNHLRCDW